MSYSVCFAEWNFPLEPKDAVSTTVFSIPLHSEEKVSGLVNEHFQQKTPSSINSRPALCWPLLCLYQLSLASQMWTWATYTTVQENSLWVRYVLFTGVVISRPNFQSSSLPSFMAVSFLVPSMGANLCNCCLQQCCLNSHPQKSCNFN